MSISLCIQLHFYIIHLSALLIRLYIFVIFCRNFVWLLCAVSARQPAKGNTLRSFWKVASAYCVAVSRANVISSFCLFVCLCEEERVPSKNTEILQISSTHSLFSALCVFTFFYSFFCFRLLGLCFVTHFYVFLFAIVWLWRNNKHVIILLCLKLATVSPKKG